MLRTEVLYLRHLPCDSGINSRPQSPPSTVMFASFARDNVELMGCRRLEGASVDVHKDRVFPPSSIKCFSFGDLVAFPTPFWREGKSPCPIAYRESQQRDQWSLARGNCGFLQKCNQVSSRIRGACMIEMVMGSLVERGKQGWVPALTEWDFPVVLFRRWARVDIEF